MTKIILNICRKPGISQDRCSYFELIKQTFTRHFILFQHVCKQVIFIKVTESKMKSLSFQYLEIRVAGSILVWGTFFSVSPINNEQFIICSNICKIFHFFYLFINIRLPQSPLPTVYLLQTASNEITNFKSESFYCLIIEPLILMYHVVNKFAENTKAVTINCY